MAATEPGTPTRQEDPASGDEPLTTDLAERGPRITTRAWGGLVVALVVVLLVSLVVAFVVLHQPRLTPVPVPSVSSIA